MNELPIPAGVASAKTLLNGMDECFGLGLSRLGAEQLEALASVSRVFAGTPLGESLRAAVEGLSRAEFREEHFVALAAARSALHGAQYDALVEKSADLLGYVRPELGELSAAPASGPVTTWMSSSRQWLMELALAGFLQLEREHIMPFAATLEQLQADGSAPRLAMLLTGMVGELLDVAPVSTSPIKPLRRWADLWSRAMVSAMRPPDYPKSGPVHGALHLLGVELRHSSHAVSAVFHGVMLPDVGQPAAPPRHMRITASAYKVDVLDEDEVWLVLGARYITLFEAYMRSKVLHVKGAALWATGDLRWSPDHMTMGPSFDPIAIPAAHIGTPGGLVIADLAPLDRHTAQVGLPYFSASCTVPKPKRGEGLKLQVAGLELELDLTRTSDSSALAGQALVGATECFGLLRFDGGQWRLQPLLARQGKKLLRDGDNITLSPKGGSTLGILKERSGRLLRVKS